MGFPGTWMTESESMVYRVVPKCACSTIGQIMYYSDQGRFYDGDIHDAILRKFPKVTNNGPHRGKPTKMPIKELHEIACELNRNGVKLPFRPRRKTSTKKK